MAFKIDRRTINRAMVAMAASAAMRVPLAQAADRRLTGSVIYRERIALPDTAEVVVRLLDITLTDSPPTTVAETRVAPAGQVPVSFELTFDYASLEAGSSYALQGEILAGDEIMFASPEPLPYDPDAAEAPIELLLVRQSGEGARLPAELTGAEWQVSEIAGFTMSEGVVSTLLLNERGTAGGNGGCNRFFATVTSSGEALTFSEIGSTFMACEDGAMAQEQAYFAALAQVASYRLEDGRLVLADAQGQPLVTLGLLA